MHRLYLVDHGFWQIADLARSIPACRVVNGSFARFENALVQLFVDLDWNEMIRTILALCSCDIGGDIMYGKLEQALAEFRKQGGVWQHLIHAAEKQGVAPLLYKHFNAVYCKMPDGDRRLLQSLYLRNRRSNSIRNKVVAEVLQAYESDNIDVLIVKGIALCNFAYSETALRPMRDIDLLVKKRDLKKAEAILFELGYEQAADHDIPEEYYHLVPMVRTTDGLPVNIEVHHNLLPFHSQYPLWPIEKSYHCSRKFDINGTCARTLSLEETVSYVYLHGFQAPLTYEPFRFMHVADIVTLVERFVDRINWQQVCKETPTFLNVLSRFHYLTPWKSEIRQQLKLDISDQPGGHGVPYRGWPLLKLKTAAKTDVVQLTKNTLWPSQWWLQIYYGHLRGPGYLKARFIDHPRMLWRWAKSYCYAYALNFQKRSREVA